MPRTAFVFLLLCALSASARAALPHTLRACGDANGFPPALFRDRAGAAGGIDVDVLRRVLEPAGYRVEVELIPWARCVLLGARGDYQIVLDGVRSPRRERAFLFPVSHYSFTPIFVWLRKGPPPDIQSVAALARYRICSQADYNYELYGVPAAMITNRAPTIDAAAAMLKLGRCEVMLQNVEVLRAHHALGGADLLGDPSLASAAPAWMPRVDFYLMVGRGVADGPRLVALLTRGIESLKRDGALDRIRAKYQNR